MNKNLFSLFLLLIAGIATQAQISVTTNSTASICYNDGTLTIHATGGTAPYIDSILSGPANPNLSYPIALPSGQNVFTNLPHGSFTVRVHDAAGHSGTFTDTVGGTYEFPADTLYQHIHYGYLYTDTLFCDATPGTGHTPYQYAISSTGANSGFGPYQSENFFARLCAGTYWVRLRDSCGNIYTNSTDVMYNFSGALDCANFTTGDFSFSAVGGVPPYTYTITNGTTSSVVASNHTGVFTSLSLNTQQYRYYVSMTDSCGETYLGISNLYPPFAPSYSASCPFSGMINASFNLSVPATPAIFTCLNCVPIQSDTIHSIYSQSISIFHGLHSDSTYIIRLTDGCGNVFLDTTKIAPHINAQVNYTSCRGVYFTYTYSSGQPVPSSAIDSVALLFYGQRYVNTTGIFNHLPVSFSGTTEDTLIVYTNIGCNSILTVFLTIPNLNFIFEPEHSANCDKVWAGATFKDSLDMEDIFFISSNNDTILGQPIGPNVRAYYDLTPGAAYTIVSDSGCSVNAVMDTITTVSTVVSSYVTCLGQPVVTVIGYDTLPPTDRWGVNSQPNSEYIARFFLHDSLMFTLDSINYSSPNNPVTATWNPTDTGLYTYKIYKISIPFGIGNYPNIQWYYLNRIYDTICIQDSGTIYVTRNTVPFPYVNTSYLCNGVSSGPPMLTIYGGSIPYTVQIQGVDTIIMNTNSVVFTDTAIGTYNIIAYDNCGISRSFTFSIRDTCSCAFPANVWTYSHTGLNYQFRDSLTAIGSGPYTYSWDFGDGSPPGNTANTSHTYATAGMDTVTLIVTAPCGSDTVIQALDIVSGIDPMALISHVSIYPNPSQGSFTIRVDGAGQADGLRAAVIDIAGREIYSRRIHTGANLFEQGLAPGVYTVKISDGSNTVSKLLSVE